MDKFSSWKIQEDKGLSGSQQILDFLFLLFNFCRKEISIYFSTYFMFVQQLKNSL